MSLIFALILTAGAAVEPAPARNAGSASSPPHTKMQVPTPRLYDALTAAPTRRRTAQPRYCFNDRLTAPSAPAKLCRTREEWLAFGLEPIAEETAVFAAR